MTKRAFDLFCAFILLIPSAVVLLLAAMAIKLTSPGPVFHLSKRVGRRKTLFKMAKLRTMRIDTPQVATHLLADPDKYLTPIGAFLRRTSIDEIPQLWNIIIGDMSFVGPRPALFNQDDLVSLREEKGINELAPGLTGWAQINGRDDISIPKKVELEEYYLKNNTIWLDIKIIFLTAFKMFGDKSVSH